MRLTANSNNSSMSHEPEISLRCYPEVPLSSMWLRLEEAPRNSAAQGLPGMQVKEVGPTLMTRWAIDKLVLLGIVAAVLLILSVWMS